MRKKTQKEFEKEIYELTKNEYIVISKYNGVNKKIRMKHNIDKCNYEWDVIPTNFIKKGSRCPKCNGHIKFDEEIFLKELSNKRQNTFIILSQFKGIKSNIKVKNISCGHEFETKAEYLLYNDLICPICYKNIKKTTDEFREEVYDLVGNEYTILGEYQNNKEKILIKHNCNKCNKHEFEMSPISFLRGKRCPKCQHRSYIKTTEEFKQEIYSLTGNEYTILGEYKGNKNKILIIHNICNHKYLVQPSKFLSGRRCPFCAESKGEQVIRHYLDNNNIFFDTQYIFSDLASDLGNPLRFDFAIFNNESKTDLKCLIEYDGEQHFEWKKGMQTYEDFKRQQYHDKLKNEYCINNKIKLIRIPYWQFDDIEQILNKEF